jgi:hypothetical protein
MRQKLAYRFRHLGLGAKDIYMKRKLTRQLTACYALAEVENNDDGFYDLLELVLLRKLQTLLYLPDDVAIIYPPIDRLPRNLAYVQHNLMQDCEILFRFRFEHLHRLYQTFQLDNVCMLENWSHMSGEEVFLFSLNRLAFPDRLHTMTSDMWGGEESQWSRVFKYFNLFVNETHGHLLRDNFEFWTPRFPEMAMAIQRKLQQYGVAYGPEERQRVACFIDD